MYKVISTNFCKVITLTVFILTYFSFFSFSNSNDNLIQKINLLHEGILNISKEETVSKKDIDKLKKIIVKVYDYEKMIKMIVGIDNWKTINSNQRVELIETFQTYISYNYIKRFSNINNFSFKFRDYQDIGKKYKLVRTYLVLSKDEKIQIDYLFRSIDEDWRIFDVLLEGTISEIATKKSEFSKIIEEKGVDALANSIKKKFIIKN